MKIFTTGLIVLIVAIIGSVVGGVCVCMYFYQDGRKKRQIRPEDQLEPKMMEPFSTKKYWERGRKPVILEDGDEDSTLPASVNPSSGPHTPSPLSDDISPEPLILSSNGVSTTTTITTSPGLSTSSPSILTTSTMNSSGTTTVVEVS